MNYQVLSDTRHKNTKIKPVMTFNHVEKLNNIALLMQEFTRAAVEMPIIFIKHPELGVFQTVAVTGLVLNENLFVKDGVWQGLYVPGSVGLYPFKIGKLPSSDNFGFFVDEDCDRINEADGDALFDADGKETPALATYRINMTKYHEDMRATNAFVEALVDGELLTECAYTFDNDGLNAQITGIYAIDEQKLRSLPNAAFLKLREKGYLPAIYAHLTSFNQLDVLAKRR
ncbi:MAG: SapC family protein [Psychrosphaera sp.]|nr:SapC family protein [Psychrosphaera sp.]